MAATLKNGLCQAICNKDEVELQIISFQNNGQMFWMQSCELTCIDPQRGIAHISVYIRPSIYYTTLAGIVLSKIQFTLLELRLRTLCCLFFLVIILTIENRLTELEAHLSSFKYPNTIDYTRI